MFMNSTVALELLLRFPEVIGISVESSRSRTLVFDFLVMNLFIHTILLRTQRQRREGTLGSFVEAGRGNRVTPPPPPPLPTDYRRSVTLTITSARIVAHLATALAQNRSDD